MCRFNEAELNMVSTNIRLMLELRQLDIGISTSLYLPAIGTAGFERVEVKGCNRVPAPPPKITDKISLLIRIVYLFIIVLMTDKVLSIHRLKASMKNQAASCNCASS